MTAAISAVFCSCSKDDESPSPLSGKTYTGFTALQMSYNSAPMAGKTVTLNPSGDKGALTAYSQFDLSQLSSAFAGTPALPAPGVLPGSPQLTLETALLPSGSVYSFSGSGETDVVTYSYSGTATPEKLSLDFSDVRLKDQSLAGGIWSPAPVEKNPDGAGLKSQPFHLIWESELPLQIPGLQNGIGDILDILVNLPVIPVYDNTAYMSLTQAVASGLRTLAFSPDGNFVVTYLKRAAGAAQFAHAPLCMLQYAPAAPGLMKMWVNPTDVLTVVLQNNTAQSPDIPENPFGKPSRADASSPTIPPLVMKFLMQFLPRVAPLLAEGIPVNYSTDGNAMTLYIGSDLLLPLVKDVAQTVLADPEVQALIKQALMDAVKADPSILQYIPKIEAFLKDLPQFIAATTRIELGLNLVKTQIK